MSDISLRYLLFGEDKTASAATEAVASSAEKASKSVGASFASMGAMIGGEVGEVMSKVGEGLTSLGEAGKNIGPKLAVGGAAIGGIGLALASLGSGTKAAENALKQAVENAGSSLEEYEGRINRVVKANQNLAISDVTTKNALAAMVQITGDVNGSLDKMGLVADLAASKHISLTAAAKLVAAAMNGNVKLFKQYGIQVDSTSSAHTKLVKAQDNVEIATNDQKEALQNLHAVQRRVASGALQGADAQKALKDAQKELSRASEVLATKQDKVTAAVQGVKDAADEQAAGFKQLSDRLKGSAAAGVDTFLGRLNVLKTKAGDFLGMFGSQWGPVIQTAGATFAIFGTAIELGGKLALGTRIQLALLAAQNLAVAAATKIAAAAQWLLNVAMEANPIGLIIIAIVALVAAVILAYKHSETFRAIVQGAFHAVQAAAAFAFNWIRDHWKLILAIITGPFGAAAIFVISHWGQIRSAAGNAVNWIKDKWGDFIGFFKGIPGKIGRISGGMWDGIKSAFKSMINGVIGMWNRLHFSIPSIHAFGHTIGGGSVSVPQIPKMADGGVLTRAGEVMVGDNGPERLYLPGGARVTPLSAAERSGSADNGDLGTFTIVMKSDTGEVIEQKLVKLKRTSGRSQLAFVS